jgi:hypothetical protein
MGGGPWRTAGSTPSRLDPHCRTLRRTSVLGNRGFARNSDRRPRRKRRLRQGRGCIAGLQHTHAPRMSAGRQGPEWCPHKRNPPGSSEGHLSGMGGHTSRPHTAARLHMRHRGYLEWTRSSPPPFARPEECSSAPRGPAPSSVVGGKRSPRGTAHQSHTRYQSSKTTPREGRGDSPEAARSPPYGDTGGDRSEDAGAPLPRAWGSQLCLPRSGRVGDGTTHSRGPRPRAQGEEARPRWPGACASSLAFVEAVLKVHALRTVAADIDFRAPSILQALHEVLVHGPVDGASSAEGVRTPQCPNK